MTPPAVSTPREHGGLVTIGGAGVVAALLAPRPAIALVSAAAFALGYLARAQVEKLARGARLRRLDGLALAVYAAGIAAAVAVVAIAPGAPAAGTGAAQARSVGALAAVLATGLGALAIPAIGAVVRRARAHRSVVVELGGLAVCGGAAGVAFLAGGGEPWPALGLGLAMAGYGASSAPLVRAEVRHKLPAAARRRLTWLGAGTLVAFTAATAAVSPALAPAFLPRCVHALARSAWGPPSWPIAAVIARECTELAVFVGLLAALAG